MLVPPMVPNHLVSHIRETFKRSSFMINEPRIIVKNDFFTSDFQTLYDAMCERVFKHRDKLFMACCIAATAIGYILYGTYPRKVIDVRITGYRNNIPQFETQKISDSRVRRLMHKECGHTTP